MKPKLLTAQRYVDLRTGCMYRYVYCDTERFRPHYHDYYEIFLVLNGHARHLVNGAVTMLSPRDLIFIRPGDTHDYVGVSDGFSMLNITFTRETLQSIFDFLGKGFPSEALLEVPLPPQVQLTAGEFEALNARMKTIGALSLEEVEPLKTALRVLIFDIFTKYFSGYGAQTRTVPLWLEELCSQMRQDGNFTEGSEKLFALANKSREHVCRSMKKYMGLTVTEFINDLRLNYIANMLRNSNLSVTDIIFNSGFNNISWTAELFKKKYGMTMSRFRKK